MPPDRTDVFPAIRGNTLPEQEISDALPVRKGIFPIRKEAANVRRAFRDNIRKTKGKLLVIYALPAHTPQTMQALLV